MPTHEEDRVFLRDVQGLTEAQRRQFWRARAKLIEDLRDMENGHGTWFRAGLVHKLRGADDLYELRWARDGRATFSLGETQREGFVHIRWHRCGTHEILP